MDVTTTSDDRTSIAAQAETPKPGGAGAATADTVRSPSDAIELNDREIIILSLKPSLWHITLRSLGVVVGAGFISLLLAYAAQIGSASIPWRDQDAIAVGVIIIAIQIALQGIDWLNRSYILTDRRIVTIDGVFRRRVSQTALRHVEHVAMHQSDREQWVGVGDLLFTTDETSPAQLPWVTVRDPARIQRLVIDAIDRYGRRHPGSSID